MGKDDRNRQGKTVLYGLYRMLGTVVHVLLLLITPLLKRLIPDWDIESRLGRMPEIERADQELLIWIHAASIGEVQAARALMATLIDRQCGCRFFLTTMTRQGREVASAQLPADVHCGLAPLDTPQAVARALRTVRPDVYICLETELWPVLLTKTRQARIPMLLLNGRMSERSCRQYSRIRTTMAKLLSGFAGIAVIREQDGERYRSLGVTVGRIRVCGNMKYDLQVEDRRRIQAHYKQILQLDNETIFICGSTRSGEEELLLPVYRRLRDEVSGQLLWILAPRHLDRLSELKGLLDGAGLEYDLLSGCKEHGRSKDVVLVDSMGELADLYSVGDYNFCGGSLVDRGGHNIMEPVRLQKPVYFGPFMKDFQDAVELVLAAGAGFQVDSADGLADCLAAHLRAPEEYQRACGSAAELAVSQQGAVRRQADMVIELAAKEQHKKKNLRNSLSI
jgi:3-deoxy-D-manno-octulosonic-acid transferase